MPQRCWMRSTSSNILRSPSQPRGTVVKSSPGRRAQVSAGSSHKSIMTAVGLYGHLVWPRPLLVRQRIRPNVGECARNVPRPGRLAIITEGQMDGKGVSRPVGRVLCARLRGAAVIHLGLPLPTASCGLPASIGRAALKRSRRERSSPLDLAPGGVYQATAVTCGAGGLLHHRFTLTFAQARRRFVFCGTFPRVTPGRRYRPPCPEEPGPSSPGLRPARPPGRLTRS
jgi:hypothetical protein